MAFNVNVMVTELGTGNDSILWTTWEYMVAHEKKKWS